MEEPRPKPKARPDSTPKHAKYRQLSLPSSIGFTAVLPTPLGYLDRCHCWQCVPARLKATEKAGQEHRRGPSTVKPRPKAPPYTARWGSSGKAGQASRLVHRRLASSLCVVWCYLLGPAYMLVHNVVRVRKRRSRQKWYSPEDLAKRKAIVISSLLCRLRQPNL